METQKIVNLLGGADNKSLKFATRKWYVIPAQNNTDYGEGKKDSTTVKFETKVIKSSLEDYSDAYILVAGDLTAIGGDGHTRIAFRNCAASTKYLNHINNEHVDNADNLDIIMPIYNLIEYSDNYSDTSGSLWQIKRDERRVKNTGNSENISTANSRSLKYKSSFFKPLEAADNRVFKDMKKAVPIKCLSSFCRSLEMPLINCKIHLALNWTKDCVMSTIAGTAFKITSTNLYVSIVTLSSKESVKLLEEGFKRLAYWNDNQTKIETRKLYNKNLTIFTLLGDFSFLLLIILLLLCLIIQLTILTKQLHEIFSSKRKCN